MQPFLDLSISKATEWMHEISGMIFQANGNKIANSNYATQFVVKAKPETEGCEF